MKTYKLPYNIVDGIANILGEFTKVQGLQSCSLLKPTTEGLVSDDAIEMAIDWDNTILPVCNFPFPQVMKLSDVTLILTETSIYEYKNPKRGVDFYPCLTVSAGGRPWKVADFGTYITLTNGMVTVVKDPDTAQYIELEESKDIPQAESLTNFNGQCIAGGIDNSWSFYEMETLYIPPSIYNIVLDELKEVIGEVEKYEHSLKGQTEYVTPKESAIDITPQGYIPPTEVPTSYFTITALSNDFTSVWDASWNNYSEANALCYVNGKLYLLLKTTTATHVVLSFIVYNISGNSWSISSGKFTELRYLLSAVKQSIMYYAGKIYVTCNSEVDKIKTANISKTNCNFMEANTTGFMSFKGLVPSFSSKYYIGLTRTSAYLSARLYTYYYHNIQIPVQSGAGVPATTKQHIASYRVFKLSAYKASTGVANVQYQIWALATNPGNITTFPATNPFSTITDKRLLVNDNKDFNWTTSGWLSDDVDIEAFGYVGPDIKSQSVYIVVGTKLAAETSYRVCLYGSGNKDNISYYSVVSNGEVTPPIIDMGEGVYGNPTLIYNPSSKVSIQQRVSFDNSTWGLWNAYPTPLDGERYIQFKFIYAEFANRTIAEGGVIAEDAYSLQLELTNSLSFTWKVREDAVYDIGTDSWSDFTAPVIVNKKTQIGNILYTLVDSKIKKYQIDIDKSSLVDEADNIFVTGSLATAETIAITTDFNYLYLAGGKNSSGTITNTFKAYNPVNDTWNTLPTLPSPVYGGHLVYVNASFYYIGGYSGPTIVNTNVYRYKLTTGRWETLGAISQSIVTGMTDLDITTSDNGVNIYIYNNSGSTTKTKSIIKFLIQA